MRDILISIFCLIGLILLSVPCLLIGILTLITLIFTFFFTRKDEKKRTYLSQLEIS